ncbi:MAG TPA: hypothetical protein VMH90_04565 [Thermoplasmata archaeon]|nr:hypothetical protein [Thermoplasmata archaeon]
MTDLNDRPAVPPMDTGADERFGYFAGGGTLIALGWGVLDLGNYLAHRIAGSGGLDLGVVRVYPGFGPFSQAAALFGAGAGVLGLVLLRYGMRSPAGRFVLPGTPY